MERVRGIEPLSTGWKPVIIATIRYPLCVTNSSIKLHLVNNALDPSHDLAMKSNAMRGISIADNRNMGGAIG